MDTAVAAALAEMIAALASMAPRHEGLRDFARLNLQPDTLREVRVSLDAYDRRTQRLLVAKAAIEALIADTYPELAPREISASALQDLTENAHTIDAALAQFAASVAARLNLVAGSPEPKG